MNQLGKVNAAMKQLFDGRVQEAAYISSQLLAESPDDATVQYLACEVAVAQNQPELASTHINRAVELNPQEPELRLRQANVELICRRGLRAQEIASELADRFPGNLQIQLAVARIFTECGNHAGAETYLLNAGAIDQNNPRFLFDYSTNQFFLGKTAEAEKAIADFLALGLPTVGRKLLLRSRLKKQTPGQNHVEMLRDHLAGPLPDKEAVNCYFALAKELEDIGEYQQSFETLQSATSTQRRLVDFNLAAELKNIDDIVEAFQPDAFAAIPDSSATESPLFIVGLPRTGTTLVERIVGRHEGVVSAGETNDFTLAFSSVINEFIEANPNRQLNPLSAALEVNYDEIAARYLRNMRGMFGQAERYLDKTPFNFLYCGLIRKAFPKARILHLVRDPMDTCYAVFKTLFNRAYFYSYNLDELAEYYIRYSKLMDHWRQLMPEAIMDVSYEELVTNPQEVSRRIADYTGLEWSEELIDVQSSEEPCATASAAQVREPINTESIGLWRHYESGLAPLRERLEAAKIIV